MAVLQGEGDVRGGARPRRVVQGRGQPQPGGAGRYPRTRRRALPLRAQPRQQRPYRLGGQVGAHQQGVRRVRGVQRQHGRGPVAGQRELRAGGGGRLSYAGHGRVLVGAAEAVRPGGEDPHRHPGPEVRLVVLRAVPRGALPDRQHAQRDGEDQQQHRARPAHRAAGDLPARQRRGQPPSAGRPAFREPGHRQRRGRACRRRWRRRSGGRAASRRPRPPPAALGRRPRGSRKAAPAPARRRRTRSARAASPRARSPGPPPPPPATPPPARRPARRGAARSGPAAPVRPAAGSVAPRAAARRPPRGRPAAAPPARPGPRSGGGRHLGPATAVSHRCVRCSAAGPPAAGRRPRAAPVAGRRSAAWSGRRAASGRRGRGRQAARWWPR